MEIRKSFALEHHVKVKMLQFRAYESLMRQLGVDVKMDKTIWKYEFEVMDGSQRTEMPVGAKLVFVSRDPSGFLCAWFEVDPTAETEIRQFEVHGTGHPITKEEEYLGSVVASPFVWHLYEFKGIVL